MSQPKNDQKNAEWVERDRHGFGSSHGWRVLTPEEIDALVKNQNTATFWESIQVVDPFDPSKIKNTQFIGNIRIGTFREDFIEWQGLRIPTGITSSLIMDCDLGDNVAIHHVHYLDHYIIGDCCLLWDIGEMLGSGCRPFEVQLMNEKGTRKIIPFKGMIPADAYLWAKYRDNQALQEKFEDLSNTFWAFWSKKYGRIGAHTVVKNVHSLRSVETESYAEIQGALALHNVILCSSEDEKSTIGEGVECSHGIIGYGCRVTSGVKAFRFVLGNNVTLSNGALVLDSFVGDNSTISGCEVRNALLFPGHEQHHNNSFLISALIKGQSNVAAGAVIGSNHNSRANDGELEAGRGFWPGLCVSVKYPSRFASFVLLAKGDYPYELDIPFPFALVSNHLAKDQLEVLPAYFWLYNLYALVRNEKKFQERDKRKTKTQRIEYAFLAPDTIEEMLRARTLLEMWVAKAEIRMHGQSIEKISPEKLIREGRTLLSDDPKKIESLEVLGEGMENSNRKVVIRKVYSAYHAYGDMVLLYAVKTLLRFLEVHPSENLDSMNKKWQKERLFPWVNCGGQLITKSDLEKLLDEIVFDKLTTWDQIHAQYHGFDKKYFMEKSRYAFAVLCHLFETEALSKNQWHEILDRAIEIQESIQRQVYLSRKKDFEYPFRHITFQTQEEMSSVLGNIEDDQIIQLVREKTLAFKQHLAEIKKRK